MPDIDWNDLYLERKPPAIVREATPAGEPPGYAAAYQRAKANGTALVLFVGCKSRELPKAEVLEAATYPGCAPGTIVVGRWDAAAGVFRRTDLPMDASLERIVLTYLPPALRESPQLGPEIQRGPLMGMRQSLPGPMSGA